MNFLKISKALSDNTRFHILQKITELEEVYCTELTTLFNISQPSISHHLKVLGEAELLESRKEGQHTFFSVNQGVMESYIRQLQNALSIKAS